MRSLGLGLIVGGALATVGAMFLETYELPEVAGQSSPNWWEAFNGLDIALLAACGASVCLAIVALISGHRVMRQLAAMAAALTFGLAFAVIPDTIHDSEYASAGIWIVAATGAIAVVGGVIVAVTKPD